MAIFDGVSFSSGDEWSNWANTLSAKPERLFYPNTLEDLQVIIREATENKKKDGTWIVTVESGVEVSQLDVFLKECNPPLALASNVMLSDIRFGGILSMGCIINPSASHNPFHDYFSTAQDSTPGTVSDTLTEITIVNAYGELHIYSEADDPEAFNMASINLGLLGIIYTATIKVIPMSQYRLRAIDSYHTLESFFEGHPARAGLKLKELVLGNDSTELLY
ncbi:D-arabinono-1,4-lactone oxidase [Linnemannia exigua]|uniref:D-arabinono-1,4-lactone oxidase n=1 Tax=Linnemannia exigua TaxID=604196 RepID=A0AAD4DLI2_9FUNG|nr:D-arabinono-1,4-lactone oxidase [Linnemannia exigua]